MRDVDENNLSHHFLEEVAVYPEQLGSQRAGAADREGPQLSHNFTMHHEDVT